MNNISITIDEITEDIHLELIPVGLPGPRGFNAFEVWQKVNPGGTMEEYYQFLKGEPFRFEDFTPEQIAALKIKGDPFTYDDFTPEQLQALKVKGDDGRTAYEVAVANGFPGSESEWLASLKGEPFKFEDFTEAQKESLKIKGDEGLSAYEVAVRDGFVGTESEWLASLKGETGDMPIGALNEFLLNYFDEPIVNLNSRAQTINQKLRFVQKELDEIEVTPNLLTNMAATSPGKLHSVIPSDGSGDWTFERNSIATYVDKDGLIKTAAPDVPRIDWTTGEPMLLVEESATNLFRNSIFEGDGTPNHWSLLTYGATDYDASLIPRGTYNTMKIGATDARIFLEQTVLVEEGRTYTVSVLVTQMDLSKDRQLLMLLGPAIGSAVIATVPEDATFPYMVKASFTAVSTDIFYPRIGCGVNVNRSMDVEFSLPQVERGVNETSRVLTADTSVTRVSDSVVNYELNELLGTGEGVFFLDAYYRKTGRGRDYYLFELFGDSNPIFFRPHISPSGVLRYYFGGKIVASEKIIPEGIIKLAVRYSPDKVQYFVNGSPVNPTGSDGFDFSQLSRGKLSQPTSKFTFFKTTLSDAHLISMTAL